MQNGPMETVLVVDDEPTIRDVVVQLSAITRGWVREDWALRHHPKWVEQLRQGDVAR